MRPPTGDTTGTPFLVASTREQENALRAHVINHTPPLGTVALDVDLHTAPLKDWLVGATRLAVSSCASNRRPTSASAS